MKHEEYTRLIDVYFDYENYGPFYSLQNFDVPWKDQNINQILDMLYITTHGNKKISPMLDKFILHSDDDPHTVFFFEEEQLKVASMLYQMYGQKWKEIYKVLSLEYNPIENYSMREAGTDLEEKTGTDKHALTGTDAVTKSHNTTNSIDSGDITTTTSIDVKTENNIDTTTYHQSNITEQRGTDETLLSGFNSSSYVDGSKITHGDNVTSGNKTNNYEQTTADNDSNYQRVTGSGTNNKEVVTDTQIKKEIGSGTDSISHNTMNTETVNLNTETTHEFTRSGNIGVTTSQQMQQSSIELWQYKFFDEVFKDIDRLLTLSIYI